MTDKRYFDEPLTFDFQAEIESILPQADGTSHVMLNRTYFYPTGGGQSHDIGTLADLPVIDVIKQDETVIHVVQGNINIARVQGSIDREYRLGNMQAHTGQHLLSAAFVHALDAETLAVKMSATAPSTVDIAHADLTPEQVQQVEQSANSVIMENRPVKSYFVKPDAVPHGALRRHLNNDKIVGDVRIVEIVDWDVSACAGTHLPTTGMLGTLKIIKTERYKGGTRVYFVVGYQALALFQHYHAVLDAATNRFSTGTDTLIENVDKALNERADLSKIVEKQQDTLLTYEKADLLAAATTVDTMQVIKAAFDDRPPAELKRLATLLINEDNVLTVLTSRNGADVTVAVGSSSTIHAGNFLRALLADYKGRGGGNDNYAQGVCKGLAPDKLDELLASVDNRL